MGFSRQEYWNGLPRPPPGDLPGPGIEPVSVMSPALAGGFFTTSATWDYLTIFASILWWMAICVSHSTMVILKNREYILLPALVLAPGMVHGTWRALSNYLLNE